MNKRSLSLFVGLLFLSIFSAPVLATEPLPPIKTVTIGPDRVIKVNDHAFFPIMAWLLDQEHFAKLKECNINTVAGYWPTSSDTKNVNEYLDLVEKAGLYGVLPSDERLKGRSSLLAYIHDDEPDLPHSENDAKVVPSENMTVNRSTPMWKLVDGVVHSWTVFDPLEGSSVRIQLKKSVTAEQIAVWLTISKGLAVAKEVSFAADGKEVLQVTLEAKKGKQSFALEQPVTFKELTMKILSTYPDKNGWGSISEIGAFDASGKNVILSPPRQVPRMMPPETMKRYLAMKAADPNRPIFMTLTGHFSPHSVVPSLAELV